MSKTNVFSVKESVNQFGFELFKVFISRHKKEYKNLCFSPFAVYNSLATIIIGAKNTSESQLASVLHMKNIGSKKSMLRQLSALREDTIKANHDIMQSIHFLYVDKNCHLRDDYKELLKEYFEIKPKSVTFANIEGTVNTINNDSKESTDDVIDEVIHSRDITGENQNVKLILSNSLYFRGFWATKFDELEKQSFKFGKRSVEIQMIKQLGKFKYLFSRQLKAQVVSIPYVASDIRMIVILPEDKTSDGIYLIEYLNKDLFESIMSSFHSMQTQTEVELSIPRFALEAQKVSLQKTIKQMGAIDIFDSSLADLSHMCDNNIHLTKLVHKAFILVDERGSNVSQIRRKSKETIDGSKPLVFQACHPFVFIIVDKISNVALFMGYFGDPTEMLEVVRESDLSPEQINQLLQSTQH